MAEGVDAGNQLAALDLGSNSFHLIVASEQSNGRLQVVDKLKEMVRLADGLTPDNKLTPEASERALACLNRFSQRLRPLPLGNVRVVGTNTLRKAKNSKAFLADAEDILGHPIEIISGREEARLVYLGVSHALEDGSERRLVVDIGGGSTELIVGRRFDPLIMESLYMGCVSMSKQCFGDGNITAKCFNRAEQLAAQELEPVLESYRREGWDRAIGSSGTILATQAVLAAMDPTATAITRDGLARLRDELVAAGHVDKLSLSGLGHDRSAVFPGGVAILTAIFDALGIDEMITSTGALREGLLQDLVGRVHQHDVRDATIDDLAGRYHVDRTHARRVRDTARSLLAQTATKWQLTSAEAALTLGWAAELHEIGMDISHSQYHKHGGYLLQNMDMLGFSRAEQQDLAALVRAHRRKFPTDVEALTDPSLLRLAMLLRIAVLLHRNRSAEPIPHVGIKAGKSSVVLQLPKDWLERHPLTELDLEQEAAYLRAIEFTLTVQPQ